MPHHSCVKLAYHIVWTTKNREALILPSFQSRVYSFCGRLALLKSHNLIAVGGTHNHIHCLITTICTDVSPREIVILLKANSSRFIRQNFVPYFAWQEGYGIFTVNFESIPRLLHYIKDQDKHHQTYTLENELLQLENIK
jgi:REP element-mobilizing transposase RayT